MVQVGIKNVVYRGMSNKHERLASPKGLFGMTCLDFQTLTPSNPFTPTRAPKWIT